MLRNRRWIRRVIAGTAGVVIAAAVTPAMSAVARDVGSALPRVDYELKLSSSDVQFTVRGRECSASLVGSVEAELEAVPQNGGDSVVDFNAMRMRGSSSSCEGNPQQAEDTPALQGLGRIRIEQNDTAATPPSVLEMTGVVPPTFEQTVFMGFTMTVENPPSWLTQRSARQAGPQQEPLTLVAKEPAELVGRLESIPPRGVTFRLQDPVELVRPGHDETVVTLDKLPLQVSPL